WYNRVGSWETDGFRQTQTALNTYFMLGHRYAIIYETPVLGPPWELPFEFPLYEWVVAAVVTCTGWPLDQTGRLVSRIFYFLCLFPCWHLLRLLRVSVAGRLIGLSLFLLSPVYIIWSRAFLIETTVLFLALSTLACTLAWLERPRLWLVLLALGLATLTALVKITTFAGCLVLLPALWGRACLQWRRGLIS